MNNKPVGIKQQLEAATTKAQVEALLEQVRSFDHASKKTKTDKQTIKFRVKKRTTALDPLEYNSHNRPKD